MLQYFILIISLCAMAKPFVAQKKYPLQSNDTRYSQYSRIRRHDDISKQYHAGFGIIWIADFSLNSSVGPVIDINLYSVGILDISLQGSWGIKIGNQIDIQKCMFTRPKNRSASVIPGSPADPNRASSTSLHGSPANNTSVKSPSEEQPLDGFGAGADGNLFDNLQQDVHETVIKVEDTIAIEFDETEETAARSAIKAEEEAGILLIKANTMQLGSKVKEGIKKEGQIIVEELGHVTHVLKNDFEQFSAKIENTISNHPIPVQKVAKVLVKQIINFGPRFTFNINDNFAIYGVISAVGYLTNKNFQFSAGLEGGCALSFSYIRFEAVLFYNTSAYSSQKADALPHLFGFKVALKIIV